MIEFKNITKRYGKTAAIDRISLKIPESGIYCLLGRNGAGKTTLMKLLAGHIGATEGEITVDGKTVSTSRMPECVNFIESGSVQFNMKVSELIETAAAQDKWYGWVADILIIAIISVFTPIAPLRAALVRFFNLIIFHSNAFIQIAACLILALVVYSLNKLLLARKAI